MIMDEAKDSQREPEREADSSAPIGERMQSHVQMQVPAPIATTTTAAAEAVAATATTTMVSQSQSQSQRLQSLSSSSSPPGQVVLAEQTAAAAPRSHSQSHSRAHPVETQMKVHTREMMVVAPSHSQVPQARNSSIGASQGASRSLPAPPPAETRPAYQAKLQVGNMADRAQGQGRGLGQRVFSNAASLVATVPNSKGSIQNERDSSSRQYQDQNAQLYSQEPLPAPPAAQPVSTIDNTHTRKQQEVPAASVKSSAFERAHPSIVSANDRPVGRTRSLSQGSTGSAASSRSQLFQVDFNTLVLDAQ